MHLPHVQSSAAGSVRGGGGGRGGGSLSRPSEYAACCLVPQSGQKANEAGESASQLAHVQSCGCSGPQSGQKRHDAGTTSLHSEQSHSSVRAGAGSVTTCWKNGKTAPCGPGNDQCGPPQEPNARPKFHVKDLTCDENDPNYGMRIAGV